MSTDRETHPPVRLAELIGALSLATDLGMGQPMEQALRTCLLSVRFGAEIGLPPNDLADVYYLALLRFVGCTADAHRQAAAVGGDDIGYRRDLAPYLMADTPEFLLHMVRHFGDGAPPVQRARLLVAALAAGESDAKAAIAEHCEVAQMLAGRLGLPEALGRHVGDVFERWDGKGLPGLLAGEAIPVPARIVALGRDLDVFHRLGGWQVVSAMLRRRRGKAYDPQLVDVALAQGERWLQELAQESVWDAALAAEPAPPRVVTEAGLDAALCVFADFVDLKVPFTLGHSREVARLAEAAGRIAGLPDSEVSSLRQAGLVHDLGKVGVPGGIFARAGRLSPLDWERVRLHPYLTERILSYSPRLGRVARLAGAHHERLDGSGYHRGTTAPDLPVVARILAVANAYQGLAQPRPYRSALSNDERAAALRDAVAQGAFDGDVVACVLKAAGHEVVRTRHSPLGLTGREIEVLRMISRGHSNPAVARALVVSPKTVGRHIENIYAKIGVSSRAAAALVAVEHGLLWPPSESGSPE